MTNALLQTYLSNTMSKVLNLYNAILEACIASINRPEDKKITIDNTG